MPYFKVASADLTNSPLLRRVAAKRKPVLLSTGASTLGEIDDAIAELRAHGCPAVVPLHCVLNYPTPNGHAHLAMIRGLARVYPDLVIGYSDHTIPDGPMTALVTSYLLGARVIEKHFTHDKSLPGNDHYMRWTARTRGGSSRSCRPSTSCSAVEHKQPVEDEQQSRRYARRSLVTTKPLRAGTVLDESCLTYKRPGTGISPRFWDDVLGMRTTADVAEDHVLTWADLTR